MELEGYQNNVYFHHITKIKNNLMPIFMLKHGGKLLIIHKEIADCTVSYFQSLFSTKSFIFQDLKMMDDTVPTLVDDSMMIPSL